MNMRVKSRTFKYLSLFLSVILTFSCFSICVFATENTDLPFSYDLYSDKQSYEKGEDISIYASLQNATLDEITDMCIWMDYPTTDYYLTPGITEHFISSWNDSIIEKFRVSEDETVLDIASKINSTIDVDGFLLRLANFYKTITLLYTTILYSIKNSFIPIGQETKTLGSVKVLYDGTEIEFTVKCKYSVNKSNMNEAVRLSSDIGLASANVKAVENSYTGITFAMNEDNTSFGLFAVNPDIEKSCIYKVEDGKYTLLGTKKVDIKSGDIYKMKIIFENNRVIAYVFDNPLDSNPYPAFDLKYISNSSGYGVFANTDCYSDFSVMPYEISQYEKSYTNPIYDNSPDPYILKDGETYYLYATTNPGNGYSVSSSKDLVNWTNLGLCAEKGDIYGESNFWAPEVYKYNGKYYMLYSTDEHLALAVANSPTGPFIKTKDGYLLSDKCIDGDLFFDDDGNVYLYMAYWGETGEEVWGAKMLFDLSGIVPETFTQLTSCKDDEGGVNEGPFMLKYNGPYFLTYSVNGYTEQSYAVRLAVGNSPLGTFKEKGTILEKSGELVGTGHHCFTTSPDGTELIIAYHCHYSTTQVHARKLCIDRCKFTETQDGYTISVYGPTSTEQPYPSK